MLDTSAISTVFRQPRFDESIPSCYGLFRDDATCGECPYARTCSKATARLDGRETVRQYVSRTCLRSVDIVDVSDLLLYAERLHVSKGGNAYVSSRWLCDIKWVTAMQSVINACTQAGWSPRTYVRAQFEALEQNFELRRPFCPGHFVGENADRRFRNWRSRKDRAYGDAENERVADAARERTLAASLLYVEALLDGQTRQVALSRAQELKPDWSRAALGDPIVKARCLERAFDYFDPTLADKFLMPTDTPWSVNSVIKMLALLFPRRVVERDSADMEEVFV